MLHTVLFRIQRRRTSGDLTHQYSTPNVDIHKLGDDGTLHDSAMGRLMEKECDLMADATRVPKRVETSSVLVGVMILALIIMIKDIMLQAAPHL